MDAMLTLYILGGCVALAALVFIVMAIVSAVRPPQLPELAAFQPEPPRPFARALTPRPFPLPAGIIALQPMPATDTRALTDEPSAPRTVIPLPAIAGIAPATRAQSSPHVAASAPTAAPLRYAPSATHAGHAPHAGLMAVQRPSHAPSRPIALPMSALPLPAPAPTPMPVSTLSAVARPSLSAPPVAPVRTPRVTMQPIAPAAPARMARGTMQPIPQGAPARMPRATVPPSPLSPAVESNVDWSNEPGVAVASRSETTMPIYRQRPSLLRTVMGWTIATLLVAASPAVVEPSLLDPLCDDYEWNGAEAAAIVRDYAYESNIAIDLEPFAITKVDANVRPFP